MHKHTSRKQPLWANARYRDILWQEEGFGLVMVVVMTEFPKRGTR